MLGTPACGVQATSRGSTPAVMNSRISVAGTVFYRLFSPRGRLRRTGSSRVPISMKPGESSISPPTERSAVRGGTRSRIPCRYAPGDGTGPAGQAIFETLGGADELDGKDQGRCCRGPGIAFCPRPTPSKRDPPAIPRWGSTPPTPGGQAPGSRQPGPQPCTGRSCNRNSPRAGPPETPAGRPSAADRGRGRCGARKSIRAR